MRGLVVDEERKRFDKFRVVERDQPRMLSFGRQKVLEAILLKCVGFQEKLREVVPLVKPSYVSTVHRECMKKYEEVVRKVRIGGYAPSYLFEFSDTIAKRLREFEMVGEISEASPAAIYDRSVLFPTSPINWNKPENGVVIHDMVTTGSQYESMVGGIPIRRREFGERSEKPMKTILLLGPKGSRRNIHLDSILNHLVGIQKEDGFRCTLHYTITDYEYNWVTEHVLHWREGFKVGYSLKLVDVSGYGEDQELNLKMDRVLEEYFTTLSKTLTMILYCFNDTVYDGLPLDRFAKNVSTAVYLTDANENAQKAGIPFQGVFQAAGGNWSKEEARKLFTYLEKAEEVDLRETVAVLQMTQKYHSEMEFLYNPIRYFRDKDPEMHKKLKDRLAHVEPLYRSIVKNSLRTFVPLISRLQVGSFVPSWVHFWEPYDRMELDSICHSVEKEVEQS